MKNENPQVYTSGIVNNKRPRITSIIESNLTWILEEAKLGTNDGLLLFEEGENEAPPSGDGAAAGDLTAAPSAFSTFTWSFIPPRQCNLLPQTKYLSPGFVNMKVVLPFLLESSTLLVLHPMKFSFVTSDTLWSDEYWNTAKKEEL